jgi:HEAT repeat protein
MEKGLARKRLITVAAAAVMAFGSAVASQPMNSRFGEVDWKKAETNYIAALRSDNLGVKQSAAGYVAEYELKGAVEPLIQILRSDKVERARMSAALALVTLGDLQGRAAVEEAALYDGSDKVVKFCESLLNASPEKFSALE